MSNQALLSPSHESAENFRVILDAMAKPGQPFALTPNDSAPSPMSAIMATIANTLCDFQSPLWLTPALNTEAVTKHLKFHTGAPLVKEPAAASFAFMNAIDGLLPLTAFAQGTHEYPDRSATLVIQVEGFGHGDVELSGPGLKAPIQFGVKPLPRSFWIEMIGNHSQYPLGVDIIFVGPHEIACCPRSTRIMLKEHA